MDLTVFGCPVPGAFAAVAVIGYVIGRVQLTGGHKPPQAVSTRRELKRAKAIAHDLELIAQNIRRDLAQHHSNLEQFKSRLNLLSRSTESTNWQLLSDEAERLIKPTQDLAKQLAQAYDGVRQQGSRLMNFTGQRCDPLTGLCNRQALDETLENYLSMHRRYGMVFSLAVFDIDSFKQVNEEHGHLHGDRVLAQVAELIEQNTRETDIVARFGGEEFIALLSSSDIDAAGLFAERIRATVEQIAKVTVSGGIAVVGEDDDAKTLLTRADTALYAAKAAGRNRIYCHTGSAVVPSECEAEEPTELEVIVDQPA
jgi:diguanylate cyclase (GGDEF)-like protein